MRQDDAEPGEEQVEQSMEHAKQVLLVLDVPVGHALMQEPFKACKDVEVQRVQVVEELTQDVQLESQAEDKS